MLSTIISKAVQLSGTDAGTIYAFDDASQEFQLRASYGMDEELVAAIKERNVRMGETMISQAAMQRSPVQVADIKHDSSSLALEIIVRAGFRALLAVPLLGANRIIGALVVRRKQPGEFPQSTVNLLQTFGAQSVVAIQNARLFDEVQWRTRDLAKSLEGLRTTQDRLVQTEKLASLGQLTAGIAHEIKNPLNFVNNFSAVSIELIDELREALAGASLDTKLGAEISEIAEMLQGNLDKVVQHGKRADSIVKNMLLHSRQGSGEHQPADINMIVEDSLNLAYHGARAEKQDFNVTLERSFDPTAGNVDLFRQEITRVLLNLISNGFYAATKRKLEANGRDYEPTLTVLTKNLGDSVEIRIHDNGTGIPPEVKEKMFNPFFHDKARRRRNGSWSVAELRHHRQAARRIDRGRHPARRVHRIQDRSAARGSNVAKRGSAHELSYPCGRRRTDVEALFRQQFRRDIREGRFTMDFAQSANMALTRIADAVEQSLNRFPEFTASEFSHRTSHHC